MLESVQCRATNLIAELRMLGYEDRVQLCKSTTLAAVVQVSRPPTAHVNQWHDALQAVDPVGRAPTARVNQWQAVDPVGHAPTARVNQWQAVDPVGRAPTARVNQWQAVDLAGRAPTTRVNPLHAAPQAGGSTGRLPPAALQLVRERRADRDVAAPQDLVRERRRDARHLRRPSGRQRGVHAASEQRTRRDQLHHRPQHLPYVPHAPRPVPVPLSPTPSASLPGGQRGIHAACEQRTRRDQLHHRPQHLPYVPHAPRPVRTPYVPRPPRPPPLLSWAILGSQHNRDFGWQFR